MLFSIQFPLADSRGFLGGNNQVLGRPTWPAAAPDEDFVRSFGSIRRRKLGGVQGWIGEGEICEANRALRFTKIDAFRDTELSLPLKLVFRRFYFDGLAVGKFEAGLTTISLKKGGLSRKQVAGFIKHVLDLSVITPPLSEKAVVGELAGKPTETVLGQAGRPLARFYSASSIAHQPPVRFKDWWVQAGSPLLFLIHESKEKILIPFSTKPIPRKTFFSGDLSYCEVPYGGKNLRMWIMGLSPYFDYREARVLKICLLRLHAEHEALRLILRNISTGKIEIKPRTSESSVLQHYLNESTRRISRLSSQADHISESDVAELARESEDLIHPGDRDNLLTALKNLDVRKNIYHKVEEYIKTDIFIREINMGNKYNISGGQIGAVGDNASASGNTFNQWNQAGGDIKVLAQELAKLREELGKQAKEAGHFESAAAVAKAQTAAQEGNGTSAFEHLKTAGQWALEVAKSIGVPIAIEALKKSLGM
ncbi:MAG: hypothetical protein JNM09_08915 [Blastocatellia bacterium]|nr:hypothetical protein [Blastocatellia bacterium]